MGRLLIWLSGARPKILALADADRPKYSGMGAAVLITATMATISMTFALHTALKASLGTAILFAIAWGLAIMSLDRWLVVSLVRQQNKFGYFILALPRIALGILFGLIISTPFTLQIFQSEINQRITVIQDQRSENFYKELKTSSLTTRIAQEQAQVNNDNKIIQASGMVDLAQQPAIAALTTQLGDAQQAEGKDYALWQCELYGKSAVCTAPVGDGPVAEAAHQAYLQDLAQVSRLQGQLTAAKDSTAAKKLRQAQHDFPSASAALKSDQTVQTQQIDAFVGANASNAGLLLRLQALDQYSAGDNTLQKARWLLFLFFTAIECLPILTKVLLNLGPENTYEKLLPGIEQETLKLGKSVIPEIVQQTAAGRLGALGVQLTSLKRDRTVDVSQNGNGGTAQSRYRPGRL